MKYLFTLALLLINYFSFGQSISFEPNKTQLSYGNNQLIIGKDSSLSGELYPFFINRPLADSIRVGVVSSHASMFWGLQSDNNKNQFSIQLNSKSKPSMMNFLMPKGRVSINESGNLLLGGTFDSDTSTILLDVKSHKRSTFITASGVAISGAQRVLHTHPNSLFSEVHGIYAYSDSAKFVNSSIFAETGKSGLVVNIGVFGRVYQAPQAITKSIAVVGFDAINASNTYAGEFHGKVDVIGNLTKSSGSFKIDHPLDRYNKYLYHSFVESPDMMNIYNGNITTGIDSLAEVTLPNYFQSLNMDFRYQLTVIGQFAQAIVWETISSNKFKIKTDKANVQVSWMVTGIRKDAWAQDNRIIPTVNKPLGEQGTLLYNNSSSSINVNSSSKSNTSTYH